MAGLMCGDKMQLVDCRSLARSDDRNFDILIFIALYAWLMLFTE